VALQQVLINLISNAIKFTQKGVVKVSVRHTNKSIKFEISDTGIGISQQFQEKKLFQAFSQEESNRHSKMRGLGLGLVLTKKLADEIGATIQIHSVKGMGTSVLLELPWCPSDDEHFCGNSPPSVEQSSHRVTLSGPVRALIVDDNPVNLRVLKSLMTRIGFQCFEAKSGEDAVRFMAQPQNIVDLILMDIFMPGIGGFEAIRRILALPLQHKPMIAVCSADSTDNIIHDCQKFSVRFVPKPVKKEELVHLYQKLQSQ